MLTDLPFPESFDALAAQCALLEAGRKPCVLVPHTAPAGIIPEGFATEATTHGLVVFSVQRLTAEEIRQAVARDEIGLILGYGVPRKPAAPVCALVLEDKQGHEVLAVLVDEHTAEPALLALADMRTDQQRVVPRRPVEVVRARLAWWQHYFSQLKD